MHAPADFSVAAKGALDVIEVAVDSFLICWEESAAFFVLRLLPEEVMPMSLPGAGIGICSA